MLVVRCSSGAALLRRTLGCLDLSLQWRCAFICIVVHLFIEKNYVALILSTTRRFFSFFCFSGFIFFWGWVFLVTTSLVLIFKKEVDYSVTNKLVLSLNFRHPIFYGLGEDLKVVERSLPGNAKGLIRPHCLAMKTDCL